ncbi:MAG: cupin domain-containing protein [Candidatus Kapabacteria bacterium]|nr:cupin domain-containing protein [Ignavibacteriota bacterium]MCW5884286.1 cupin domain-containing protein [Candidatus Kapabacteria bacterium]
MLESNKKVNLHNDIEYQTGSVVSSAFLKKPSGNITFFAFDKGEQLSPHSAPFDALVHVIEGQAEIMIGEDFHSLNSGEIIIMPAGITHAVKATEKFKMMLVMLKS